VSLFERFLLRGRRQVAGEIRREFDFAHSLRHSSQPSLGTSARYLINTVLTKGGRGIGTGSDCPIVCPAVSVFLNPAPRVAL